MTRQLTRLAVRWAWSTDREHLWRLVAIASAAVVSAFALVLGIGYVHAAERAEERRLDRTLMVSAASGTSAPGELRVALRGLHWRGQQISVVWVDGDERSTVPRGLSRLPEPGAVAISPALSEAGFGGDAQGFTVGTAGQGKGGAIGEEGLASRSEWLIYARPPDGRTLGAGGTIFTVDAVGSAAAPRGSFPLVIETVPPAPTSAQARYQVGLLVLLPAMIVLWSAGGALSGLLEARLAALRRLGLGRGELVALVVVETCCVAWPAALSGAILAKIASPSIVKLPGSALELVPGDLAVGWLPLAVVVVVVTAVACVASIRSPRQALGEPGKEASRGRSVFLGRWPLRLLGVSIVGMLAGRLVMSPYVVFGGLLLAAVVVGPSVPSVVRAVFHRTGQPSPHLDLAVRRVVANPAQMTRPAGVVAVLMLVTVAWVGVQSAFTGTEPEAVGPVPTSISWRDARSSDVAALDSVVAGADLEVTSEPGASIAEVVVTGTADQLQAAEVFANATFSAPNVMNPARVLDAGPDRTWPVPLASVALLVLTAAALISFGNRALAMSKDDVGMLRAGLGVDDVRRVQQIELMAPAVAAMILGSSLGLLFIWAGTGLSITRSNGALIVVLHLCVMALTGLVVLLVGRLVNPADRRQHHPP